MYKLEIIVMIDKFLNKLKMMIIRLGLQYGIISFKP